jgi:hypothetical protein
LCPPSLTHLFGDDARIREALEADRRRPYQAGSFRSKPNFSPRSNKSKKWTKKKPKPARKSRGKSSYAGPAGKAPALPPRRGRARRISEFIKGGRGGGSRVSVPSPDPSPCHNSLSICPRPTTIWRSGADFLPFWKEELETSPQLLQAVEGYHPPLMSQPPLSFPRARFSTPSQGSNNSLIDAEVAALLEKGAIEEVELHPRLLVTSATSS